MQRGETTPTRPMDDDVTLIINSPHIPRRETPFLICAATLIRIFRLRVVVVVVVHRPPDNINGQVKIRVTLQLDES